MTSSYQHVVLFLSVTWICFFFYCHISDLYIFFYQLVFTSQACDNCWWKVPSVLTLLVLRIDTKTFYSLYTALEMSFNRLSWTILIEVWYLECEILSGCSTRMYTLSWQSIVLAAGNSAFLVVQYGWNICHKSKKQFGQVIPHV